MAERKKTSKAAAKSAPTPAAGRGVSVVKGELPPALFGAPLSAPTLHQLVVRQRANARAGTQKTKARGETRGGGAKPWRQKGTGRARAGSRRSPLWRGGAMIHALSPRDYSFEMPRKMRRAALRGLLSQKAREGAITVVEALEIAEPKTRLVEALLDELGVTSAAFLVCEPQRNFLLGARNLPEAKVLTPETLNPIDLVSYEHLVVTQDALAKIEGVFARATEAAEG